MGFIRISSGFVRGKRRLERRGTVRSSCCPRQQQALQSVNLSAATQRQSRRTRRSSSIVVNLQTTQDAGVDALAKVDVEQKPASTTSTGGAFIYALLALLLHLILGVGYCVLVMKWSIVDALYFCIVTITTVGYGDLAPTTSAAKLFFMLYILLSLTIVASALNAVVGSLLERQENLLHSALDNRSREKEDPDHEIVFRGFTRRERNKVISSFLVFLSIVAGGVLFFMAMESMGLVDAMYFIWITSTTVGFGDMTPTRQVSKLFSTIFLVFSTLGLAGVIGSYAEIELQRRHRAFRERVLQKDIDSVDFANMDADDDDVLSRDEFLVAMLRRTDAVPQEDIDAIFARFDELDVDGNGYVDKAEVDLAMNEK